GCSGPEGHHCWPPEAISLAPGPNIGWPPKLRIVIAWGIRQMRRENLSIQGLARQLGVDWHTAWAAIRPLLEQAAADERRFAGVKTLWSGRTYLAPRQPRPAGPEGPDRDGRPDPQHQRCSAGQAV